MTDFRAPEPLIFSGNLSENWRRWSQRFDLYLTASGKVKENGKTKVAILLHLLGEEGIEIYNNFTFLPGGEGVDAEDKNNLETIMGKFQVYCNPRKNTVMERYTFWEIKQKDGETVDQFVNELKTKAKNCEFGDQNDLMIRDRIIFGVSDSKLRERLLRESESLNLDKIIDMCRAAEISKKQIKTLEGEIPVDVIRKQVKGTNPKPEKSHTASGHNKSKQINCKKCGNKHLPKKCPAFGKKCNICKKLNHFQKQCFFNKNVHEIQESDEESTFYCGLITLDTVSQEAGKNKSWFSTINVNKKPIEFKLDSGAEANVISRILLKKVSGTKKLEIEKTSAKLTTYGNNTVKPLGKVNLQCHKPRSEQSLSLEFYVVDFKATPILGLQACEAMNLIQKIDSIKDEHKDEHKLTKSAVLSEFHSNFTGLGKFEGDYKIELNPNAKPVINPPRAVPETLMPKLKTTLEKLQKSDVIEPVEEATDWVNNLVIVEKSNGSLRLCLDPKELNKEIKRQHFKIPTLSDVTSKLNGKTVFTILDEKDGYHQVALDEQSSYLCTFQTPLGRYRWKRMPFGICSASEVFQRKNIQTFGDIQGVHMIHDDMIIAGTDEREHDEILLKVMRRAEEKNIKFNKDKIQFKVHEVKYMGSILGKDGVKPDPEKIQAIVDMPDPEDKKGIERLLGTVNFLSSYIPNMSEITAPIRELMKKDIMFVWQNEQKQAFEKIKTILTSNPVLKFYDVTREVTIQTDSSQEGVGSCLLQQGHPIAYASRALTDSEKNYAQIERELLAIVFACEKFNQYIYGKLVTVQTDHKPLQAIYKKPLHKAPPRLQRMLLRLQKYQLDLQFTPGKNMYVADTLSRAYLKTGNEVKAEMEKDMDAMIHTIIENIPFGEDRLRSLRRSTENDRELIKLREVVEKGWPSHKGNVAEEVKPYWNIQDEIHVAEDLVFVGNKIVIPSEQQAYVLSVLHESHLGMEKCKARARKSLYWPNMNRDIEKTCSQCGICNKYKRQNQKETLIQHEVPQRPWQKVGIDLFEYKARDYVLIVDYYSKFIEIRLLQGKTAKSVAYSTMSVFSVHGIPEEIIADNMPFNSKYFQQFGKLNNIKITTSSPTHSQSNGMAERSIQTVKNLFKKAAAEGKDEHIAMLEYRNTPISGCDYSPAQLLMNRMLRDKIPTKPDLLNPKVPEKAKEQLTQRQTIQKRHYDKTAKDMTKLSSGDSVRYLKDKTWEPAVVTEKLKAPRSYKIHNENGQILRRNRVHLQKTNENAIPIIEPYSEAYEENYQPQINKQLPTTYETATTKSGTTTISDHNEQSTEQMNLRSRRYIQRPARYRDKDFVCK